MIDRGGDLMEFSGGRKSRRGEGKERVGRR
jgi:hypothetical protein